MSAKTPNDEITFESLASSLTDSTGDPLGDPQRAELREIWSALDGLESERTQLETAQLEADFFERLTETVAAEGRPSSTSRQVTWPAFLAAAATLLVGIALGVGLAGPRAGEIEQVASELDRLRLTLVAALADGRSPGTRLTAIGAAYSIEEPASKVVEGLLHAVESDNNIGVRLAALDALDRFAPSRPFVAHRLFDSLPYQHSPLVQMAVLDRAATADPANFQRILREFLNRTDLLQEVRARAQLDLETSDLKNSALETESL